MFIPLPDSTLKKFNLCSAVDFVARIRDLDENLVDCAKSVSESYAFMYSIIILCFRYTQSSQPISAERGTFVFQLSFNQHISTPDSTCRLLRYLLFVLFLYFCLCDYKEDKKCIIFLQSGFVGAIPHLIMTSLVPIGGMLADYLRKNNIMTTTNVRKLFNCGGFGLEAFFFVLVAYANNKVNNQLCYQVYFISYQDI